MTKNHFKVNLIKVTSYQAVDKNAQREMLMSHLTMYDLRRYCLPSGIYNQETFFFLESKKANLKIYLKSHDLDSVINFFNKLRLISPRLTFS